MEISTLCDDSIPRISPEQPITHFEHLLLSHRVLAVFQEEKYQGLVIRNLVSPDPLQSAQDCMITYPVIQCECSLVDTLQIMKEGHYSVLPIFKHEEFMGVAHYPAVFQAVIEEHISLKNHLFKLEEYVIQDDVIAGFIHDLNNIMTALQANIEMVMKYQQPSLPVQESYDILQTGIDKTRHFMKRLSRKSKQFDIKKEKTDFKKYLIENLKLLQKIAIHIKFSLDVDPKLLPLELDHTRFFQVLSNLTINAIQAMPQGGSISFKAENFQVSHDNPHTMLTPGQYIHFSVSDTGTGVEPEIISRLFTRYFTTKPQGNGLGLAVSRQIIEGHDGIITLSSELGRGTTFHIFLPAC